MPFHLILLDEIIEIMLGEEAFIYKTLHEEHELSAVAT
jgi:hypothetical protein